MQISTPEGREDRAAQLVKRLMQVFRVDCFGTALDYGTGSGSISFALAPHSQRVLAVDKAAQVVADVQAAANEQGLTQIEGLVLDLEQEEPPADLQADLIACVMALHHIHDVPTVVRGFATLLTPGGAIALADLDVEDGSFHGSDSEHAHNGLDRQWLRGLLEERGFSEIADETAYVMKREHEGGVREYPIFLLTARKPG